MQPTAGALLEHQSSTALGMLTRLSVSCVFDRSMTGMNSTNVLHFARRKTVSKSDLSNVTALTLSYSWPCNSTPPGHLCYYAASPEERLRKKYATSICCIEAEMTPFLMLDGKRLIELPNKQIHLVKLQFSQEEREVYQMVCILPQLIHSLSSLSGSLSG